MKSEKRRILILLTAICVGFAVLILYLSYFQIFMASGIKENPYNKRLWINEDKVLRGSIYDRDQNLLAYSEENEGVGIRVYKYDRLYSHIIGYSLREYGKSGLEKNFNSYLVGASEKTAVNELINLINPVGVGNNLSLTIDHSLQAKSRELLNGRKGSIISMDPKTGEILSLVSLPDFNVNTLTEDWSDVSEDSGSPLYNRASQGLYTPGSVFKLITTLGIIREGKQAEIYKCTGTTVIDGKEFSDYDKNGHGDVNLKTAFAKSCNTYFATRSVELGHSKILELAEEFQFNSIIKFELETSMSAFPKGSGGNTDLAASGIGQGRIMATPLNMLLSYSAVANDGIMMEPYLVSQVISPAGKSIYTRAPVQLTIIGNSLEMSQLQEMLREVVKTGTGRNASIKNVEVSGKTGTAENQSGKNHAWFVGYAPSDDPKIVVVVVLEEEGSSGGSAAAPIARDLLIHALNNVDFKR